MTPKITRTLENILDYVEAIFENFQDGVYITDGEAKTVYVNHQYELVTGLPKTEMLGQYMQELLKNNVISISGTLMVMETRESVTIEQSFRTGKRAMITSVPIFDESGSGNRIIMIVTIVREITEMHLMRKELLRVKQQNQECMLELEKLQKQLNGEVEFAGYDESTLQNVHLADKLSLLDDPVLISGESGVGKEKIARYIHAHSKRSGCPFMLLNFSVLPQDDDQTLIEYLFGHERREDSELHLGVLESAAGGTVYVDEVTDMPSIVRGRFLSLLRNNACHMGDGELRKLDIRIIASSRYSYQEIMEKNLLEEEILRCFSMIPIHIRPLRERKKDIVPLMKYFLDQYEKMTGETKHFTEECFEAAIKSDWPGNIRQLNAFVKQAAMISMDNVITLNDMKNAGVVDQLAYAEKQKEAADAVLQEEKIEFPKEGILLKEKVARLEARYMEMAFERCGNTRDAASSLGIDASTFTRKRQRYKKLGYMDKYKAL